MALTQIKAGGLADNSVDTDQLAASAVETAKINNDAVTLAKMATAADGAMITYDTSGNPVAITGTNGQVATSAGADAVSAFEAPTAAAITGTSGGADTRVATYSAAGTLIGDADFVFDDSTTRVGIGTASPGQALSVDGAVQVIGDRTGESGSHGIMDYYSGTTRFYSLGVDTSTKGSFLWNIRESDQENDINAMSISNTGNIGIGTITPRKILHTMGAIVMEGETDTLGPSDNGVLCFAQDGYAGNGVEGYINWVVRVGSSGDDLDFNIDSIQAGTWYNRLRIDRASGDVVGTHGNYHESSDERLKQDIVEISDALDKVKSIRGVKFNWKDEDKRASQGLRVGVIAQDIEAVLPEAVHTDEDGNKAVLDANQLSGLLIEAIKELSDKVEALESA